MMELTRKRTRILSVIFSLITLSLFLVGAAQAATFCVSDAAGLHNALSQAASNGEDDTIQIVQGTYVGNFIYASIEAFGVTIEGGYTANCASREVDPANTVLDGNAAENVLVLSCPDHAAEFVVDGVTLQNGNTSTGGGLFAKTYNGEITLTNNTITGNSGSRQGGGVYVSGSTVTPVTLTNNTITGNSADCGGGVYAQGSVVTLTNNTITGNSAGASGGGVYVSGSTTANFTNNTITENSAGDFHYGGGVYVRGRTVNFTNNTITGNSGSRQGGGVYVYGSTTVTLTNNTITGNSADGGGGVYVHGSTTVTLTNNTITGNSADCGGGVLVNHSSTVTLTNNTITGNSADCGGGVYVCLDDNSDTAHIYNNIIYNNTAVSDGNDLFIENDRNLDFVPSLVNLYNNDFDQSASGTYIQIPFPIDPSNLDNLDPLFVDAMSGDYHLIGSSPCIDAGDNSAPALPETDKDGQPRIMDGIVDMGAYEYPGLAAPVAEFYGSPTSGKVPLEVQFTDQSIGTVNSWSWNFGDGGTSSEQNPTHTYGDPGTYTVSLTVTGPLGSDTETKTDYITVTLEPPVPDIKANGEDGPLVVMPGENVDVTVLLEPGSMTGEACDWWIGAFTAFGTYWLDPSLNWVRSDGPISVGQYGLFGLAETSLLNISLPEGIYTFFFVLDNAPDNVFGVTWYDYVNVICQPAMVQMETLPDFEAGFLEKIRELMK